MLPVTPEVWEWGDGHNVTDIRLESGASAVISGGRSLYSATVRGFFPSKRYGFLEGPAVTEPERYIAWFRQRAQEGTPLRYIVGSMSRWVILQRFTYSQSDGSGDVDYTLTVREYEPLTALTVNSGQGQSRDEPAAVSESRSYIVKKGDTLSGICKAAYGECPPALVRRLAAVNGIKNINIIQVGQVIKLPPRGELDKTQPIATTAAQEAGRKGTEQKVLSVPVTFRIGAGTGGTVRATWTDGGFTVSTSRVPVVKAVTLPMGTKITFTIRPPAGMTTAKTLNGMGLEGEKLFVNRISEVEVMWRKKS